ncbi:hypothetical protein [Altererythrobacter sp.]|uniref:hypothetical protein n=1 Tax=Altererythrobacter sp. TaxID=1872480 RepID=UPI003D0A6994
MSRDAFAHVHAIAAQGIPEYAEGLDHLRGRIKRAYALDDKCEVGFAASGTDLEYLPIAAVRGRAKGGVHNILLGADEVGSGCIHSAHGHYFAEQTPLGVATKPGVQVPGLERVFLADVPVRCGEGLARTPTEVLADFERQIAIAHENERHALVHVVHGSKTGLILPDLEGLDYLRSKWGGEVTFVVDACQARITTEALREYVERDAIVFLTGSKFMGGPPFNGFAILPRSIISTAQPPSGGLATIFARAEWPQGWQGRENLTESENPGLLLRYEASVFELERFQKIGMVQVERVIDAFERAIKEALLDSCAIRMVRPFPKGQREEAETHPIEMRTLVTLDLSAVPGVRTFQDAQKLHRKLAVDGIRLGQPVKCVRLEDNEWGGTLRIGLSMPQMVHLSQLDNDALSASLHSDMSRIAAALQCSK